MDEVKIDVTSLLVWSEGEASSGEEGEPAASLDNWSNFARLAIASRSPATMGRKGPALLLLLLVSLCSFGWLPLLFSLEWLPAAEPASLKLGDSIRLCSF